MEEKNLSNVIDEIDHVREYEEVNYQTSRKALSNEISLVQDLLDLYTLLREMVKASEVKPHNEIITALQFLLGCRYQLSLGALALLRGHLNDSDFYSRKAIELCAFAARVKKHPHLALVWLAAGQDDASYERYREKFSPGKIFPEDHAVLGKLADRYDVCCKDSHPSLYALAPHIETERTATELYIKFSYFQLKENDISEPVLKLLWLIDIHFGILRVFEEVLIDVIAYDRKKWEIRQNAVEGKFLAAKNRWKPVIRP